MDEGVWGEEVEDADVNVEDQVVGEVDVDDWGDLDVRSQAPGKASSGNPGVWCGAGRRGVAWCSLVRQGHRGSWCGVSSCGVVRRDAVWQDAVESCGVMRR